MLYIIYTVAEHGVNVGLGNIARLIIIHIYIELYIIILNGINPFIILKSNTKLAYGGISIINKATYLLIE